MEAEMFENPHIVLIITKQRHEELLAECQRIRMVKSALKRDKKNIGWFGGIVLFVADLLIKIGICLKRRWVLKGEECDNGLVISLDDR